MLKQAGVEIFAVGMGGGVGMASLSAIATDRFHVFIGLKLGLRNLLSKLVAKICAATPRTKPTTRGRFGLFVCAALLCLMLQLKSTLHLWILCFFLLL